MLADPAPRHLRQPGARTRPAARGAAVGEGDARENIDSNYELIKRLEPYVRPAATSTGALATATRAALAAQLPELLPHSTEIIDYLSRYFGMDN